MAAWTIQPGCRSVLDPALGTGLLLRQALAHLKSLPGPATRLIGYEVDPAMCTFLRSQGSLLPGIDFTLRAENFIQTETQERYDAILCNPPYRRHHELKLPETLFAAYEARFNLRLSRMTNVYALFILHIAEVLAGHGRAAILTPAEYLNANFGEAVKRYLLRENLLDGLVVFDSTLPLFDGAITTGCLTLLRRDRSPGDPIQLAEVCNLTEMDTVRFEPTSPLALDPERKWAPESRLASLVSAERMSGRESTAIVPLSAYVTVDRGIATGANRYFSLSEAEAQAAGLDPDHLRPCLTKSHHARGPDFTLQDFEQLRQAGRKVYLLDTSGPPSPALERYLAHGQALGIPARYLPSHRHPWHRPDHRQPADILVTVFSRTGFRFILNRARVLNLTAFHCLYLRPGLSPILSSALMAFLTSPAAIPHIAAHCRSYGDGLAKLEPNDVGQILVPDFSQWKARDVEELARVFEVQCYP